MEEKAAKVIAYPQEAAQAVSPATTEQADAAGRLSGAGDEADFLDWLAGVGVGQERLRLELKRVQGEAAALRAENRWEDLVALLHPVEEKVPELARGGLAGSLMSDVAFALGHLARFDEAIAVYQQCLETDADNFHFHAGLAYTAYDSLYAARGRRIVLHPAERKIRVELAHRHFSEAQRLRPSGVTNYYRQGMLYKQIQHKREKAMPLFETAVRNWEDLSDAERQARHQERKNYVKSLYQLASCLLDANRPVEALESLEKCLREDEGSDVYSAVHKYFALGKVHYHLGRLEDSLQALAVAAAHADPAEDDFVFELKARVHLAAGQPDEAWEAVNRVPLKRRRPYVRWTEADILMERDETDRARQVLREAAERDRRGRHKALVRLARMEFRLGRYEEAFQCARQAGEFFLHCYENPYQEGLFWQAAALLRLGRLAEAAGAARELEEVQPNHPHLGRLKQLIGC